MEPIELESACLRYGFPHNNSLLWGDLEVEVPRGLAVLHQSELRSPDPIFTPITVLGRPLRRHRLWLWPYLFEEQDI